jgi:8-oxo-dGTP pyrophosphatase MutT (NUDIX family)
MSNPRYIKDRFTGQTRVLYQARHYKRSFTHGGVILHHHDKVAVVFGRQHQKWSFPKGHIDKGETVLRCAERELEEETGIVVKLPWKTPFLTFGKCCYFNYYLYVIPPNARPKDNGEVALVKWMTVEQIRALSPAQTNNGIKRWLRLYDKF